MNEVVQADERRNHDHVREHVDEHLVVTGVAGQRTGQPIYDGHGLGGLYRGRFSGSREGRRCPRSKLASVRPTNRFFVREQARAGFTPSTATARAGRC